MHVEKDNEHGANTERCRTSCRGHQQSDAAKDFRRSADPNQSIRVGVMVGHDTQVKTSMPEVIDAARHIEEGLEENTSGNRRHERLSLSGEYTIIQLCFRQEFRQNRQVWAWSGWPQPGLAWFGCSTIGRSKQARVSK